MNTLMNKIKNIFEKIRLSKINFLNHKFKKYIIKYEEKDNKLKIINSNGDFKLVDNNIPNKVKVMEIIKEHNDEINKKIDYYECKKDDYKIIIISSSLILITLGLLFLLGFFFGSIVLFYVSFAAFSISLYLYCLNLYKILLFREEVKRLKYIKSGKTILDDSELKEIFFDTIVIAKNKCYEIILKIINIIDNIKVKFN